MKYFAPLAVLLGLYLFPRLSIVDEMIVELTVPLPSWVVPGQLLLIRDPQQKGTLKLNGEGFTRWSDQWIWAVVGLNSDSAVRLDQYIGTDKGSWLNHARVWWGTHDLAFKNPLGARVAQLKIAPQRWEKLMSASDALKEREKQIMSEILSQRTQRSGGWSCFVRPLDSVIVSQFASPRRLPSGTEYLHTGSDYRAAIGTPVRSMGPGQIVYAASLIAGGNTIVIDHGEGLYSRYMHLSSFEKPLQAHVATGEVIGLSGATGRVEGPHLHWEIVWRGNHANPEDFLQVWAQICDPKLNEFSGPSSS